jgi:hypothetical protein
MVVKREFSESGSEVEVEEDVKPIITPKKSKAAPTKPKTPISTTKSIQSTGSPSTGKKPKVDNSAKRIIAEEIIMVGIKGIDVDSLARAVRLFLFLPFLSSCLMISCMARMR